MRSRVGVDQAALADQLRGRQRGVGQRRFSVLAIHSAAAIASSAIGRGLLVAYIGVAKLAAIPGFSEYDYSI